MHLEEALIPNDSLIINEEQVEKFEQALKKHSTASENTEPSHRRIQSEYTQPAQKKRGAKCIKK